MSNNIVNKYMNSLHVILAKFHKNNLGIIMTK